MKSFAIVAFILLPGPGTQDRAPAPEAAAQKEAEKLLREIFKEEYAKKAAPDRLALAKKLIQQAGEEKVDPATQFVLLREARDLAVQGGDTALALQAITELGRRFEINAAEMKAAVLTGAARNARTPEAMGAIAKAAIRAVDEAILAEDFDSADKVADQAVTLARKAKDIQLIGKAEAKGKEAADLKARQGRVKKARETLAASPDDAAANAAVGHHECLIRGIWEPGVTFLAKGPEGPIKAAAVRDAAKPAEPREQAMAGDGWWDLSEKETGLPRTNMRRRALYWYALSSPKLAGIQKSAVDKRLQTLRIEALGRGTWIDLADPGAFNQRGLPGSSIEILAAIGTSIATDEAKIPKGEYDGLSARMRFKPESKAMGLVVYQLRTLGLMIDLSNLQYHHAGFSGNNWNGEMNSVITRKEEFLVTVIITDTEHVLYLDGEERLRRKMTGLVNGVKILAANGAVSFDQIRLRVRE